MTTTLANGIVNEEYPRVQWKLVGQESDVLRRVYRDPFLCAFLLLYKEFIILY